MRSTPGQPHDLRFVKDGVLHATKSCKAWSGAESFLRAAWRNSQQLAASGRAIPASFGSQKPLALAGLSRGEVQESCGRGVGRRAGKSYFPALRFLVIFRFYLKFYVRVHFEFCFGLHEAFCRTGSSAGGFPGPKRASGRGLPGVSGGTCSWYTMDGEVC
ncbi:Hypothetical protein DEACI_0824 [Acididesulfobacillus acetoxydans]|uniref:Uncharacterized protein n=1 Tax=Acididesulfobacillus acetoxydans TaxID=1561005 RepID=A0A8S0WEI9_9FIRM|nr:Hypothetical protein DEACI_0824 [Acididesulfobacillus acetoxydans]CEJ09550.1 Hypothetical protein DEACI_4035 [Acididesulfobacillus acetoxydans]